MASVEPIYREIASKITREENKTLPRVLKKIASLEQAKIMRELPNTVEEIAKKLAVDKGTVSKNLQILYEQGLVTPGRKRWNLVNNLVLVKDRVGSANPRYDDNELFDLLREMSLENSDNLSERLKSGEKIPPVRQGMRVVPKWRAIKDIPGILPIEDMREIFKNPPIVVHNCPCRVVYRARPCKDTVPIDICLATGSTGRRFLERDAGRELSYDELIAFLDKLDEFPLVSTAGNSNIVPTILCSCCNDCCGLFVKAARTKPVLGQVTYAKSRFVVQDNPEECTACGICADTRCPVGAITMKDFPELGGKRSYTNVEECIGCGLCVLTCPNEARKMKLVRPPEHIPSPASMFDNPA
jgi:formate hydrogenlyase subunit 6/NADH:ubiquinone oxidoreductase subunit I/DNA-binding transcriptional regulator YhcF (GntR family)